MRRFLRYGILLVCAMAVLSGCGRPKTIPDEKLEKIFEDIFLANSYYSSVGERSQLDSLDIYRPILKKHGYKVKDLTYTVENYSKRKSQRISDVVEASIRRLEKTERHYAGLLEVRDTLEARASRRFASTVYLDSMIRVFSLNDTAKLRIKIPVREGDYRIEFTYLIDSLDQNGHSGSTYELLDASGRVTKSQNRGLTVRQLSEVSVTVNAKPGDDSLRIRLAGYGPQMKRPHVTIESIRIVYTLPVPEALDSMFMQNRNKIFTFPPYVERTSSDTTHRGTLRADPPWLPQGGGGNI